jgi:hypothetical protein
MSQKSMTDFANWLAIDQPALFVELYKRSLNPTFGDFTDVLSSIGDSLSNAASSVGSYLTSAAGAQTIAALGTAYLTSQASKNAVSVNLARAQAGIAPAPIQTVLNPTTGQYEAVLTQPSGAVVPVTSSVQATLIPGIPNLYLYLGGGLLLLLLLLRR